MREKKNFWERKEGKEIEDAVMESMEEIMEFVGKKKKNFCKAKNC